VFPLAEKLSDHRFALELACLVKMWAKKGGLTEATKKGRLSCHGWMLLVIEYLNDRKSELGVDTMEQFFQWLIHQKLQGDMMVVGNRTAPCDFEPHNVAEQSSVDLLKEKAEEGLARLTCGKLPW
jgi:hypothetical protein